MNDFSIFQFMKLRPFFCWSTRRAFFFWLQGEKKQKQKKEKKTEAFQTVNLIYLKNNKKIKTQSFD